MTEIWAGVPILFSVVIPITLRARASDNFRDTDQYTTVDENSVWHHDER